ncbi:MAG: alpha/beta hydrolase [Alistipes sp.]|nr:alpha/beta hydrolase [Alistipes sp.]
MRKVISWSIGICIVLVITALGGGYYLTEVALRPRFERNESTCLQKWGENYPTHLAWGEELYRSGQLRETTLTAPDHTILHAYYLPAEQHATRTAVVVHGYTDHPFGMLHIAQLYREQLGCNILLPTLRFHGKSGGTSMGMGWQDRLDIKQWIEHAPTLFEGEQQVIVHGLSMGAAAIMMLSGEKDLPASVCCFVEDCGYTSVWEQFKKELKEDYHLPAFPVLEIARRITRARFGWDFHEASAIEAVRRSTHPMLFIHGGNDHYVPTRMVYPLYEAKVHGEKAIWIAPDSGHADAYMDHPEAYSEQVVAFCEQYFNK